MAELLVKNSLGGSIVVRVTVTLYESAVKGDFDADPKYILIVGTKHLDLNGDSIPPEVVHDISKDSIDKEIENAVNNICSVIDWGEIHSDIRSPAVIDYGPTGTDVDILSNVYLNIKDNLPSSGVDLSNLQVILDIGARTFDVTNDVVIKGGPFEYSLLWRPDARIRDTHH